MNNYIRRKIIEAVKRIKQQTDIVQKPNISTMSAETANEEVEKILSDT